MKRRRKEGSDGDECEETSRIIAREAEKSDGTKKHMHGLIKERMEFRGINVGEGLERYARVQEPPLLRLDSWRITGMKLIKKRNFILLARSATSCFLSRWVFSLDFVLDFCSLVFF